MFPASWSSLSRKTLPFPFLAFPAASQEPPKGPPLEILVGDASSGFPVQRRRAMEQLLARGPEGKAALRPVLDRRIKDMAARAARLQKGLAAEKLRQCVQAELPLARKEVLAFLEDPARFTRAPDSVAEMERQVARVRAITDLPAQKYRARVKDLDDLASELEEILPFARAADVTPPPDLASTDAFFERFNRAYHAGWREMRTFLEENGMPHRMGAAAPPASVRHAA